MKIIKATPHFPKRVEISTLRVGDFFMFKNAVDKVSAAQEYGDRCAKLYWVTATTKEGGKKAAYVGQLGAPDITIGPSSLIYPVKVVNIDVELISNE